MHRKAGQDKGVLILNRDEGYVRGYEKGWRVGVYFVVLVELHVSGE